MASSTTSISSKTQMHGAVAPAAARAPKLSRDELAEVLKYLTEGELVRAVKASPSMEIANAAVLSTSYKKTQFKKPVLKMIAVLRAAGAQKQVDRLTQLISSELFRNPTILFSDKMREELNKEVLLILSTLDNPALFALRRDHMDMLRGFGVSSHEDFVVLLIRGTEHEEVYIRAEKPVSGLLPHYAAARAEAQRAELKSAVFEGASRMFLARKDYPAALACASVLETSEGTTSIFEILPLLVREGFSTKSLLTLISSFDDELIENTGKELLFNHLLTHRSYSQAITIINLMSGWRQSAAADELIGSMKSRNFTTSTMQGYLEGITDPTLRGCIKKMHNI